MGTMVARRAGYAGAVLLWLAAAGALVAAAAVTHEVGFAVLRHRAEAMVGIVAALVVLAALPVGRGAAGGGPAAVVRAAVGCVVAFEALAAARVLRVAPPVTGDGGPRTGDATTVLTVSVVLLGLVLLAAVRVTARRAAVRPGAVGIAAGCGFAAALLWLGLTALVPAVASSAAPALLAVMATAGAAAYLVDRRAAGDAAGDRRTRAVGAAVAAMVTAVAVTAAIDGLLPLSHEWVRNSAPPWEPGARLVDPVGLLVLAGAAALVVAVGGGRTRPES